MLSLTFDIDWAEDWMLGDTLEILDQYNASATFFATHKSKLLDGIDRSKFEIGLHPNFLPLLNGEGRSIKFLFEELLEIYPEAKGFRSHGLVASSSILQEAANTGLIYEANQYFPEPLKPFFDFQGLWRVPFFWRDTRPNLNDKAYEFANLEFMEGVPATFCMHPVHIYLNTENPERYQQAKPYFRDKQKLIEFRNTSDNPGARDFLISLLKVTNKKELYRIIDLIDIMSNETKS